MKMKKQKLRFVLFAFITMMLGGVCLPLEAQAATEGTIPCKNENDSVTWTLDENGVLTFSGNGTTNIIGTYTSEDVSDPSWNDYWSDAGVDLATAGVKEVKVAEGSNIQLDTCKNMFYYCMDLIRMNLSGFDTSNVTDMSHMFYYCSDLTSLNLSGLDTGNVTDMSYMFYYCMDLTSLDVSGFDTGNVTDMSHMFYNCDGLTSLDVSGFDTSNVTDMSYMFATCDGLTNLNLSNFDTSNVTNMSHMFYYCSDLTSLDVSGFNTSKVTNMNSMFCHCGKLANLDVSGFDTGNVTDMVRMFCYCGRLTSLDLRSFDTKNVTASTGFITGCDALGEMLVTEKFHIDIPEEYQNLVKCQYTITYHNVEHATNTENMLKEYLSGVSYELPKVERSCYPFLGWYTDEALTMPMVAITEETKGNLELYAKWDNPAHSNIVKKNEVATTCTTAGYTGDAFCHDCQTETKGTEIPMLAHDYDRENGKVAVQPTTTAEGSIQYTCKNCTDTITETVPKLKEDTGTENFPNTEEGTGTENSPPDDTADLVFKVTDETIMNMKTDKDVSGSSFSSIQARADKTTKNTIRLKWNKVKDADGYIIYGNQCGTKNKYKKIKTITKKSATSYTHKKLNGKKLKRGTYYKYIVRAYKNVDGQKVTIAASKTIHATTTGGKYGNAKSVKLKTDSKLKYNKKTKKYILTLKKDKKTKKYKKYTLKASQVKQSKKIKKHRAIAYESTNKAIATVSKKGVVQAKKKGTCYIYVYAQNGVYQKITVKVK